MDNRNNKMSMEWLVNKLREVEEQRDNAVEKVTESELENMALRARLDAIKKFLDDFSDENGDFDNLDELAKLDGFDIPDVF